MKNQEIPWRDEYRVGMDDIDEQHKKIFVAVNKLYDLEPYEETKENIRAILYEFSDYMSTHFKYEEEYMLSIKYPSLDIHKKLHENIINSVHDVIHIPASLSVIRSKAKIIAKKTFLHHIMKEDTKLRDYVLKQKKRIKN